MQGLYKAETIDKLIILIILLIFFNINSYAKSHKHHKYYRYYAHNTINKHKSSVKGEFQRPYFAFEMQKELFKLHRNKK